MDARTQSASDISACEIRIERIFNAPRALVWQAWTDPAHIMRWWGPQGFENQRCESDLRVGGRFQLAMRAPDGNVYPCIGTFREIVEAERIVYEGEAAEGHPCGAGIPPHSRVTITFTAQGQHTLLAHHTRFLDAERLVAASQAGYQPGWEDSLTRLAQFLQSNP